MNPLDLLKYQDLTQAVTNLLHRVPSINQQTAQIAIQQTLGDEDAAAAFLKAAMSKSHFCFRICRQGLTYQPTVVKWCKPWLLLWLRPVSCSWLRTD